MTITTEQLVEREVYDCASSLVSTLSRANLSGLDMDMGDLGELIEAAYDLLTPTEDWEEAAIEEGWEDVTDTDKYPPYTQFRDTTDGQLWACSGWKALCEDHEIGPLLREIYEHWMVSDWLAQQLVERGERVDMDFAGLTIWGRTTIGQSISQDAVIRDICAELNK